MTLAEDFVSGSALSFALISVQSLQQSVRFYRDRIGLAPGSELQCEISLASDDHGIRTARAVLLGEPGTPVGRVLLVEFATRGGTVRQPGDRTSRGFWNLNFYVDDIDARYRELAGSGAALFAPEKTHWATRWFVARDPDGDLIAFEQPDAA